jgi:hypothetical protein
MDGAATSSALTMVVIAAFLVAWAVALGSWLLAVAETLAIYLLRDRLFELGPIALRRELDLPLTPPAPLHQRARLAGSHVRFTSPTRAIFGPRLRWVGFDWRAALVKGVVRWHGSRAVVVVRQPLGPLAFLRAWLVMWWIGSALVIAAVLSAPDRRDAIPTVPVVLLGGVAGHAMLWMMRWHSRKGAHAVADEVTAYLRAADAPDPRDTRSGTGAHA